jgi:hypothetical protein
MSDTASVRGHEMSCADVAEFAGLFVLDALEPGERDAVRAHLATCPELHEEMREVGGVVPALASLAQPVDAPAELKSRVLAAVAREAAEARAAPTTEVDGRIALPAPGKLPGRYSSGGRPLPPRAEAPARAAWQLPAWASWGTALAAVMVVAVVGVWGLGVQSRADSIEQRAAVLSDAIAAFSAPDSSVAILRDSANPSASGFAAVSADGRAYLVMVGLPSAPAGQTYQAWYIADGAPSSAGLLTVDADGYAVLVDDDPLSGTQVVALTREPLGGSIQPTSDPFVVGELRPA